MNIYDNHAVTFNGIRPHFDYILFGQIRKAIDMSDTSKYEQILDALQALMNNQNIQSITVSDIAQAAGIGKGRDRKSVV